MVKLTKNKSDNDKNILELNNTQDVLSLVRLMVPKDFRFLEVRKLPSFFIIKIKKNSRSLVCFYMLLSNKKQELVKKKKQLKFEVEENISIPLEKIEYNYLNTSTNGVSNIKKLANYYIVVFKFSQLKKKKSKVQKLFSKIDI